MVITQALRCYFPVCPTTMIFLKQKLTVLFCTALYGNLIKMAALIFLIYLADLVVVFPTRNNINYPDSVHAFRSSQSKLTNCRRVVCIGSRHLRAAVCKLFLSGWWKLGLILIKEWIKETLLREIIELKDEASDSHLGSIWKLRR